VFLTDGDRCRHLARIGSELAGDRWALRRASIGMLRQIGAAVAAQWTPVFSWKRQAAAPRSQAEAR